MASARGGQRKKKKKARSAPWQGGGGGGTGCVFTKSQNLSTTSLLVKAKKTFAPSDNYLILQSRGWAPSERTSFSSNCKGRVLMALEMGSGCPSLAPPRYRNTAHVRREKKGKPAEGAGREKECSNNGAVPFFPRREFTTSLLDAKT